MVEDARQGKLGVINQDLKTQVKALNIDNLETLAEDLFDINFEIYNNGQLIFNCFIVA